MIRSNKPGYFMLLVIFFLVGCSGPRGLEKHIDKYIETTCAAQWPCAINMKAAIPFTWDKMYAFKYSATQPEIEHAIGGKLKGYRELSRYLIFTQDGKVIYSEYEPTNVEHPLQGELVFDIPDSANYREYAADSSFAVSKESSEAGPHYLLRLKK